MPTLDVPGATLFYRDSGPADSAGTAVLLHSLFFDGSMFDPLCAALGEDLRFLRPDHRGQGRSRPTSTAPDMDRLASDTVTLIESTGGGPVHLVGSSMGGYVALRIAARRPDLVATCTLLGCTAAAEQRPEVFAALEGRLREHGPAASVAELAYTMFGDDFLADPAKAAAREHWENRFAARDTDVADALRGVYQRDGVLGELAAIRVPLLLIAGEQDHAKRPADLRAVADRVPGSRLVVLPGAGHTPVVEEPSTVAAELARWWRRPTRDVDRTDAASAGLSNPSAAAPQSGHPNTPGPAHRQKERSIVSTAREQATTPRPPWPDQASEAAPVSLADGALIGNRCTACGHRFFPARRLCFGCGGDILEEVLLPREGTLYSYTRVHVSSAMPPPYTLGYVDLAEDVRVLARIEGDPDDLRCEQPVRLRITEDGAWSFAPTGPEEGDHA
ncbi:MULTISPECIES: alpha/beta fold hydrolase [Actinoalloteichus]|uniref:Hydrolase or acyltransferase of alpha/beta superfamily n=1 Tax=Actinoalloteichus fjordicus TaxID=1612552 RepID=A0AAC9LHM3_9PSEU|nr:MULTISPECIES: alpha/beta fold hydrolase [Actinoalloteichus]APU16484.1 putative hydrolase or acyltransferase of alpha/beta superfamily [Actinoalloteichus fjordicus]APU22543.1 putative hydrolase or acyltransferase of alpha/beta superfamily [Actinoalloteichus sp. GBA129-24]